MSSVPPSSDLSGEFARLNQDLLQQSMHKIRHCLDQLNPPQIWWRREPKMNSIGNLLIHLAGNLRQWGVVPFTLETDRRVRQEEFSPNIQRPAAELRSDLETTVAAACEQWSFITAGQLLSPVQIQGFEVNRMHAILHAASHFVGHTHQIILLTRLQLGPDYKFHWTPTEARGDLPI